MTKGFIFNFCNLSPRCLNYVSLSRDMRSRSSLNGFAHFSLKAVLHKPWSLKSV